MSRHESADQSTLGICPKCTALIPESELLIEYQRRGRQSVFAYCQNCDHVVRPR